MKQTHHEGTPDLAQLGIFNRLKVAITGGTSGLGLALVHELHSHGANVAFIARERSRVELVERDHESSFGIAGDVSKKEQIHRLAMQILGGLGGLDVLINNASDLGPTPLALLADTECEDFERAFATNVLGPFRLTRALLGSLTASAREGRGAVVVNISSDAAINAYPGWGAYGATKAALHHLTRIWEGEQEADGVRFLSLDPGDMDTPLHALAVPNSDRSTLKAPRAAAREIALKVAAALTEGSSPRRGPEVAQTDLQLAEHTFVPDVDNVEQAHDHR